MDVFFREASLCVIIFFSKCKWTFSNWHQFVQATKFPLPNSRSFAAFKYCIFEGFELVTFQNASCIISNIRSVISFISFIRSVSHCWELHHITSSLFFPPIACKLNLHLQRMWGSVLGCLYTTTVLMSLQGRLLVRKLFTKMMETIYQNDGHPAHSKRILGSVLAWQDTTTMSLRELLASC